MYLTQITKRSEGVVSGQSFSSSAVSLACMTSLCSLQRFPGGHSLRLAFGSFFSPHPSPLYFSTDKSVWQVSDLIGVGEPASAWIFGNSSVRVGTQGLFCPYLKLSSRLFSRPEWLPLGLRGWLMAGGCGFASHGGVTLSRGWLCQKWKPPDIPGTHLH